MDAIVAQVANDQRSPARGSGHTGLASFMSRIFASRLVTAVV